MILSKHSFIYGITPISFSNKKNHGGDIIKMIKKSIGLLMIAMVFTLTFFGAVTAHPGHGEPEKVDDATSDQGSGATTSSGTTGKTTTTSSGSTVSKSTGGTGTRSSGSSSAGVSSSSSASDGSGSAQAETADQSKSDDGIKMVENTSAPDNSTDGNSTDSNGFDDFPWALTAVILIIFFVLAAVFMLFKGGWINR